MIYQLNYRSTATPGLATKVLNDILETAVTVNSEQNITGCLLYHNNSFVQILEGSKSNVLKCYNRIKSDSRHFNVNLLWTTDVDKRYFDKWNMAYYRPDDSNMMQFVNNILLLSQLSDKSSGSLLSFWSNVNSIVSADNYQKNLEIF